MVDPYNDFISEGGKAWNLIKKVAEANHCVPNMLRVASAQEFQGSRCGRNRPLYWVAKDAPRLETGEECNSFL